MVGSRPMAVTHASTIRAYCLVERWSESCNRLGNKKSSLRRRARCIQASNTVRVCLVISNCTGCRVFCCITMALDDTCSPWAMSRTRSLIKSQARSLLSMAKLKSAKSGIFSASWSLIRMAKIRAGAGPDIDKGNPTAGRLAHGMEAKFAEQLPL